MDFAQRRRRSARYTLALICMVLPVAPSGASESAERSPANDPDAYRPGIFFQTYEKVRTPTRKRADAQQAALRFALPAGDPIRRATDLARRQDPDANALSITTSLDGLLGARMKTQWLRRLHDDPKQQRLALFDTKNMVQAPGGSEVAVPAVLASSFHAAVMRTAGSVRHEQGYWPKLRKSVVAKVAGDDCPFESGPVAITQRNFLVEVIRNGRILLFGALGRTEAYFIANAQRFAVVGTDADSGRATVEVPDRPTELYRAALDGKRLRLEGQRLKTCKIVLAPPAPKS